MMKKIDKSLKKRVNSSSLKQTFFNNFTETNGGIIRGHLPLDDLQNMFLYFVDRLKN